MTFKQAFYVGMGLALGWTAGQIAVGLIGLLLSVFRQVI